MDKYESLRKTKSEYEQLFGNVFLNKTKDGWSLKLPYHKIMLRNVPLRDVIDALRFKVNDYIHEELKTYRSERQMVRSRVLV